MLAPHTLLLSELRWQFGRAPRQPFSPRPHDDAARVTGWLPARVPGDVRADLVNAGLISPLDTPEAIAAAEWVDEWDWWYRVELPPGLSTKNHYVLEADGIDYYSAVWLDDALLATHAGMFSRQSIVLPPAIASDRPHNLRVRVWGGGALPPAPSDPVTRAVRRLVERASPGTEYFPQRMALPKAQFGYGWDFSPRVLTCGIWDDIRVVECRDAYLEDVRLTAEPLEPADRTPVRWWLQLRVRRFTSQPLTAKITVTEMDGSPVFASAELELDGGVRQMMFVTPPLKRWWPWDQGEPHLYRVTVHLHGERGIADERIITTGVRCVNRDRLASGEPWRWTVNDRHIFLRGANWVPADILPGRVTTDDYRSLLVAARDAGINFLRVWGGGVREKQAFWDECDRLGIFAWQEFPLACAFLDHYPRDPAYLNALRQEATGTVRLLRNHPSLLAWCGGNEINPDREAVPLRVLRSVVAEEDGARPWLPASPLINEGDLHDWGVWHGGKPWPSFVQRQPAFLSEFGIQALPVPASIEKMFGGEAPPLEDARWAKRKAQVRKLLHYTGLPDDASVADAVADSQRVQSAGLQAGIESCRIRREPANHPGLDRASCGGVVFWQLNEPWPAVSWSVIDRFGRSKLAYGTLRYIYQPVLVAARFDRRCYKSRETFEAEVWLVNDSPDNYGPCFCTAEIDGAVVWQQNGFSLPAGRAISLGSFTHKLNANPAYLTLLLSCNGSPLARNRYDLQVYVTPEPGLLPRLRRFLADWLVTG